MMPIAKFIKWAAKKAFDAVDLDANGKLDEKELYICVLLVYGNINWWLPTPLVPPTLQVVRDHMRKYDTNGDGTLSLEDFEPIMKMLIFKSNDWMESVVAKFNWARSLSLKIVLVPMVAGYLSSTLISKDSVYAAKAPGYLTSVIDLVSKYTLLF